MIPADAIEQLRKLGMTDVAIGAKVGARQSTIYKIRKGLMQPTWKVGHALVELAKASMLLASVEAGRPPADGTGEAA